MADPTTVGMNEYVPVLSVPTIVITPASRADYLARHQIEQVGEEDRSRDGPESASNQVSGPAHGGDWALLLRHEGGGGDTPDDEEEHARDDAEHQTQAGPDGDQECGSQEWPETANTGSQGCPPLGILALIGLSEGGDRGSLDDDGPDQGK